MDFFIDLVPALPFLLLAFGLIDIFAATKLAMAAAIIQLALSRIRYKKIKRMHLATFAAIIIFGSVTLILNDSLFIRLKTTVLNWAFALVFFGTAVVWKRNLLKTMLADKIAMPEFAWHNLNLIWVVYFLFMGGVNLYAALYFSDREYGLFKSAGIWGVMLAFMVVQGFYIYRHMPKEEAAAEGGKAP